jgi:hypothetical protein
MVGAETISTLEDASREARVASVIYSTTIEDILSRHPWNFALSQVSLARLAAEPLFGFEYAYQLPTDPKMLRLVRKNDPKNDYRIFEDKLYSDDNKVEIIYLFNPGEQNFPAYFVRALVLELCTLFAFSLMQDDTQGQIFTQLADTQMRRARNIDSQSEPSIAIGETEFALTNVR